MDTKVTTPGSATPPSDDNQPKKYIRTFAGDMETLQKGGTPDLAPLAKPKPAPITEEHIVIAIPEPPIKVEASNPTLKSPLAPPVATVPAESALPKGGSRDVLPLQPIITMPIPTPKEYIRTFAGDMKTVQGGGTPDLAPLTQLHAPEHTPDNMPIQNPPLKVTLPEPPPAPAPKERLITASPLPPIPVKPEPEPPPIPEPAPPPPGPIPLKTYSGDFSDRMKQTRASTATVLAAEQDNGPRMPQPIPDRPSRRNLFYVITGVVLLVAGIAAASLAYTRYLAGHAPVVVAPSVSAPIVVDDREEIRSTGPALLLAIEDSVNRPLGSGGVRLLYNASTTAPSLFVELGVPAPNILLRNVNTKGSMAGVVNVAGSQSPFFILSVASYSNTFSGMLAWEPLIRRDLGALFPPYPAPVVTAPVVATSTATTTGTTKAKTAPKTAAALPTPPLPAGALTFTDDSVANHDVRIYRDSTGRSVVLYGYWNQTTLVIARDQAAFTEIVQRLSNARTQ